MKKVLFTVFMGLIISLNAQVPDAFSYQAVVRSNDKELLKNQTVTVKATILRNDEVIFTQTQTATTNENGLLTLNLGNEEFQEINWLDGPLFIKTEIDPTCGNNFTIETETQLLTVPYAMAAKTAETALNVPELDYLIERVNYLETQVEELMEYVYGNEPEYPIEIPFVEYSLSETMCLWTNIFEPFTQKTFIINSYEELENYISCADGDYPEIDFTQNTLILVSDISFKSVGNILCENLVQISENEFELTIKKPTYKHIGASGWESIIKERWSIAIIAPKITEDCNVNFQLIEENTTCKLENLIFTDDYLIVINSYGDLENYINCTDMTDILEIDFSTNTLLLANGSTGCSVLNINSKLLKIGENNYVLDVDLELSFDASADRWIVKSIIAKLQSNAELLLNVTENGCFK